MRQNFGPLTFDRTPVGGYEQLPHYVAERRNLQMSGEKQRVLEKWHKRRLAAIAITSPDSLEAETVEPHIFGNKALPVYEYWDEISQAVEQHRVVMVVGETGSGKSTQVPQMLYETGYDVTLLQPRRLPANQLSARIREEMTTAQPDLPHDVVGYHTAEINTTTENTRIRVLTDGLRLAQEMNGKGEIVDEVLIIDEVHEWNINIEIIIAWSKVLLRKNPDLRVVVASATMDAHSLAKYFADVCGGVTPPVIEVPGRLHEVTESEEPDSTIVEQTVKYATQGKNILVFVPGKREIYETIDEIRAKLPPEIARTATILPLHSKMSQQAQNEAFKSYGGVKIIVATNVAQTSLTIPDIDVVISSGMERRTDIDELGVESLNLNPISQADCKQQGGRAGRVRQGIHVLTRLNDETPHLPFSARRPYPIPEINRAEVDRNVLQVAGAGMDFAELELFHPVRPEVIERSKHALRALGAFDDTNTITDIGHQMNKFPTSPSSARMLVEAQNYSPRVRAYMSAIAASMEVGGLPDFGYQVGKRWRELSDDTSSDLLMQLDLFIAAQDMTEHDMRQKDLDIKNVMRAKEQHAKIAKRSDALQGRLDSPDDKEREVLKRCIYTGMIDFVYSHAGGGTYQRPNDKPRELGNRSVVSGKPRLIVAKPWRYETYDSNQQLYTKEIVEQVTKAEPRVLGEVAVHMSDWVTEPGNSIWRKGRPMQMQSLQLNGLSIGDRREVEMTPSPELRNIIIAHALEHPGPAQRQIRDIKKELERLQNLTATALPQLTQTMLIAWVSEAAPADISDPETIDKNLNIKIHAENIKLDEYVSDADRQHIYDNAPADIEAYGVRLRLKYQGGQPTTRLDNPRTIADFLGEVYLSDGRQVWFMHESKRRDVAYFKATFEQ